MTTDPAYCTPAEAAAYLSTTPGHLATLRWRSTGPPYSKLGGTIRYSYTDLRAWMEANRTAPTTPTTQDPSHGL